MSSGVLERRRDVGTIGRERPPGSGAAMRVFPGSSRAPIGFSPRLHPYRQECSMTRILLVEDNPLNREMLSRRLERKGFQVVHAVNGAEGVAKARTEAPDLILMDMSMPVLNGWEATRQLKAAPDTRHVPVIALTDHAMVGERENRRRAGCDDYEMKPVDVPRLIEKIRLLTGRTGTTQERPTAPAAPAVEGGPAEATAGSILVVDDNAMNREVMSRRLKKQG